jgi:hypothetical protein
LGDHDPRGAPINTGGGSYVTRWIIASSLKLRFFVLIAAAALL